VTATVLAIDERHRPIAGAAVRPGDFVFHAAGTIDSGRLLDDPMLSLYCIDAAERTAIFVRTPPFVDLAQAPFFYQTQFEMATELVSVPFAELHMLAASAGNPSPLVQIHSTGRCGSTLVSQALAAADDVVSLSEPDVYYQLHQLRDARDPEFDALCKSCTVMLCAPRPGQTWAIKFRSMNIELAEPMVRAFPGTKTVFLYRQADPWARSAARAFGVFSPQAIAGWSNLYDLLPRLRSIVDGPTLVPFPTGAEMLGWTWATSMARALALQQAGVPMFIARYEELSQRPRDVLAALVDYCDAVVRPDALDAVITRDSQEGTPMSRANAQESASELTEERRVAFRQWLAQAAPTLGPDDALPGTYGI